MGSVIRFLGAISVFLASITSVSAVIIAGGDGTGDATAPADDPGWTNIGSLNGASCVYLGNGWVLTASHVGMGSVLLSGSSYAAVTSSYTRLHQPGNPSQAVDLAMFQLQTMPVGLSPVTISSTEPNSNAQVVAIGNGRDRAAGESFWDSNWNVVSGPVVGGYAGYYWANSGTKRWGTNDLVRELPINDGNGVTNAWKIVFGANGGNTEMQAAPGDSGGGVFYKRGDSWELTGIMLAIDMFSGQPANTAVFNNATYFADLSMYAGQIAADVQTVTPVPEPGSLALVLTGSMAGWLLWRRRGAAR
jgi:hypothetical protein